MFKKAISQKINNNLPLIFLSLTFGGLYAIFLLRQAILPLDDRWLMIINSGDTQALDILQSYLGWLFFRFDSWHFPLTVTEKFVYPFQSSISYTDSIPLFAIFFKLISPLLPENFQYIGLFLFLNFCLQFFWGAKLVQLFLPNNYLALICGGILFLLAPIFTFRIGRHIALTSHWLILASMWTYFRLVHGKNLKKILIFQWFLILIVSAIHPYLATMIIPIILISYLQLWLEKKISFQQTINISFFSLFLLIINWYIIGYFSTNNSVGNSGFGIYSANLNTLFNSMNKSLFIKGMKLGEFQYEGFSYLGLGIIFLLLITTFKYIISRSKVKIISHTYLPLITLTIIFTIFSFSNKIYWGDQEIISYDIPDKLLKIFSIFRASGRYIWMIHYLILLAVIIFSFKVWKNRQIYFILPLIVIIQFVEFLPDYSWIQSIFNNVEKLNATNIKNSYLISDDWQNLYQEHNKLILLPPTQCSASPTFPIFERLAALQKMKTNSMYLARHSEESYNFNCFELPDSINSNNLEKDAVYILDKVRYFNLYTSINQDINNSHYCSLIDGFVVCQKKNINSIIEPIKLNGKSYYLNTVLNFQDNNKNIKEYLWGDWSESEPSGIWTDGKTANILLKVKDSIEGDLILNIEAEPFINEKHPEQKIDILVNNIMVDQLFFKLGEEIKLKNRIIIHQDIAKSDSNLLITFKVHNAESPFNVGLSDDRRLLGLMFRNVSITRSEL